MDSSPASAEKGRYEEAVFAVPLQLGKKPSTEEVKDKKNS